MSSKIDGYEMIISSKSSVNKLKPLEDNRPPISCGVVKGDNRDVIPPRRSSSASCKLTLNS